MAEDIEITATMIETWHREAFGGFGPDDLMVLLPTDRAPPHPGEMLREEYLPDFGWSAADLAARLHVPQAVVDALLAEEAGITPDLALRLGRLFGQTPAYWIKGQLAVDFYRALDSSRNDLEQIVPVDAEPEPVRKAS
jgi:addiction module HigA family antidote